MRLLTDHELLVLLSCPALSGYAMDLLDLRAKCRLNRQDAAKIIDRLVRLRMVNCRRTLAVAGQKRMRIVTTALGAYYRREILRRVHENRLAAKQAARLEHRRAA